MPDNHNKGSGPGLPEDDEGTMISEDGSPFGEGHPGVSGQGAPLGREAAVFPAAEEFSWSRSRLGARQLGMIDSRERVTAEHPGRYSIKGEHGRGGIGRVLIAFDEHVGRVVALKELLPEAGGGSSGPSSRSAAAAARFLREARITGQLEHPGIVPVYEIARREDGTTYYTMKMVHGRTLKDKLKEIGERGTGDGERGNGPGAPHPSSLVTRSPSPSSSSPVPRSSSPSTLSARLHLLPHFLALCQAMAYAHSKGVVHRDLKPANVMIGEFGETIVLDWGLAKVKGLADVRADSLEAGLALVKDVSAEATVQGQPIGTPSYMSPEQAEGRIEDIDERSDVWGLGVILFQILTGRPPFVGETAREVVAQVIATDAPRAEDIEPGAPAELGAIAAKCLRKAPAERYGDAGELARDVANFQAGGLVSAYEYSMAALARRWLKKYRAIAGTAGLALLVLAIGGAGAVYNINQERDIALAQKQIAVHHQALAESARAVAEKNERAARLNLAEAFVQKARMLEDKVLNNDARVYYASALAVRDEPKARSGLYRDYTNELRVRLLWVWRDPSPHVRALAVSPDGKRLAASSCVTKASDVFCSQSRIDLAELASQQPGPVISAAGDLSGGLAFAADGARLAAAYCAQPGPSLCPKPALRLYDPRDGKLLDERPLGLVLVSSVASLPDGGFSVTGCAAPSAPGAADCGRGGIEIIHFDPAERRSLTGHTELIYAAAASPDGSMIASAGFDNAVGVWDARTGENKLMLTGHSAHVFAAAFSPDGKALASGDDFNVIHLWDPAEGALTGSLTGHQDSIRMMAFSPDGRYLASAGDDHTVRLWRLDTRTMVRTITGDEDSIRAISFSPNGDRLFTINLSGVARGWEVAPGRPVTVLAGHTDWVRGAALTPDGKTAVTGAQDQTIRVWDAADGSLARTIPSVKIYCLALSPDGRRAAAGGERGEVVVYNLADGSTQVLAGHRQSTRDARFSSDGRRLLTAGEDAAVKWWDLEGGAMIAELRANDSKVFTAALFPDGSQAASGGADRAAHVWELGSGREANTISGLESDVRYITISRAAGLMAVALADGGIQLRDLESLEPVRELKGHTAIVLGVDFSPDGKYLVSGGGDRLPRLWRVSDGEQLYGMDGHDRYVWCAAFSPDGRAVISGSGDGTARVWPIVAEVFSLTPAEHLEAATRETGLIIEGFNTATWDPFPPASP